MQWPWLSQKRFPPFLLLLLAFYPKTLSLTEYYSKIVELSVKIFIYPHIIKDLTRNEYVSVCRAVQFSSVQFRLSCVRLFVTPQTTAHQASLSITNSQSLLKLMSIGSVMPSNHLILCRPLLLLASIFPSIRVFANESVLHIRWPKYWSQIVAKLKFYMEDECVKIKRSSQRENHANLQFVNQDNEPILTFLAINIVLLFNC